MINTKQNYINVKSVLIEKNNKYHTILCYYVEEKRKQIWKCLGIDVKPGNKRLAERKQKELEREFEEELNTAPADEAPNHSPLLFTDYLEEWIKIVKPTLELTTYGSYERMIKSVCTYFEPLKIELCNLKTSDIQKYYDYIRATKNIKTNTIKHYHAVIRKALEDAIQRGYLEYNVARNIKHAKSEYFIASYYNKEELAELFKVAKGSIIELHILLASYYGLRREEVIGLKFDNINFVDKTITIKRTVTNASVEGRTIMVEKDRTKNMSSNRTLPLIPYIEELLLKEKAKQKANKEIFGNTYKNTEGYILVDDEGKLIKPDRVSRTFKKLLIDNNLKVIRFHDLRHSCATLLLANGTNYKDIQQYLGHSTATTTLNIYAHANPASRYNTATTMANLLTVESA